MKTGGVVSTTLSLSPNRWNRLTSFSSTTATSPSRTTVSALSARDRRREFAKTVRVINSVSGDQPYAGAVLEEKVDGWRMLAYWRAPRSIGTAGSTGGYYQRTVNH
jgi:hypothetical protein